MRALFPLLLLMACGSENGLNRGDDNDTGADSDTDVDKDTDTDTEPTACSTVQNLEIVPMNIWGEGIGDTVTLNRDVRLLSDPDADPGVLLIPAGENAFDLQVSVSTPEYFTTTATIRYSGQAGSSGFSVDTLTPNGRIVASEDVRMLGGLECPVFTVYVGLEHQWFSSQAAPPSKNRFELLMGNSEGWEEIYHDVRAAREQVLWASWYWDSTLELVRPEGHDEMSQSARQAYTTMRVMESLPDVDRKVLLNRFWGENFDLTELLNTDTALRNYATRPGDNFDVVLQGNNADIPLFTPYEYIEPDYAFADRVLQNSAYADRAIVLYDGEDNRRAATAQAASHHQKMVIIDGTIAHVTGMNTKSTDWDTTEHAVFDPRRMEFDASVADRQDVLEKLQLPDMGPRRDYTARIEGPAVYDVASVFQQRWQQTIDEELDHSENNRPFALPAQAEPVASGVPVQMTLTLLEPFHEMSVLDGQRKAIAQAKDFIFIEDQFFRSPLLNDVIAQRMREEPDLLLIVVTNEVGEWDPGLKYSYLAEHFFKDQFPDRFLMVQLRTADIEIEEGWVWDDVFVHDVMVSNHSKLRIIDDLFLMVGSANVNNRSCLYDSEMNLSVLDRATVTAARRRVFENLVGPLYAPYLSDVAANNFAVIAEAAEYNQELMDWWKLVEDDISAESAQENWDNTDFLGFVRPVTFSSDYLEVGPDMF